ncbi:MAG: integrase, partial [Rhizobiaceae bacterium]
MLSADINRYISLRRALGYKLVRAERHLLAFARFAAERDESHIRTATALTWLPTAAKSPYAMAHRLTDLIQFARFMQAEDPRHEIPPADIKR